MGVVFPALFALVSLFIWLTGGEYHLTSLLVPMFKPLGSLWIGMGVLLIGITGYIDDRLDLKSYIRLPLYSLSAAIVLVPVILSWEHHVLWIPVLVVIMVGIINTYNFMDGINGITGFYSIVLLSSVYYLFEAEDLSVFIGTFSHIIIFGIVYLLVFGFFNFRSKALAFLGDAGSVSIGLFACIVLIWAGILHQRMDVIVLLLVYGVDSVGTIILRILRKENIFKAHRSHLYQDLVHVKGLSHMKVSILYAVTQLAINIQYFYYFEQQNIVLYIYLGGLIAIYVICKKLLGTFRFSINKT
ncbi:MAG: UDP-GlcNAc:undecaprenyl-phosphate GlcNAc-1-phosphate transferase [Bacteroidia bacterium]|jgi:UDP-GlcNAc:undecaprenyl-phosphate GlcNAc-1-phosphate transferase